MPYDTGFFIYKFLGRFCDRILNALIIRLSGQVTDLDFGKLNSACQVKCQNKIPFSTRAPALILENRDIFAYFLIAFS